jgi:uncharacterized protein YqgC (DUF456 family)
VIGLQYVGATVFALVGLLVALLTPIGVPGAWMLIGVAGSVDVTVMLAGGSVLPFGLTSLAVAAAAAAAGELLEFVAASLGARAGGASRAGMAGSMIGGLVGVIAGTLLIPVPIVGSVAGALLGVAAGAVIGETAFHGRSAGEAMRPATGAVIGRVLGSLAKLPCALIAWMALVVDAFT